MNSIEIKELPADGDVPIVPYPMMKRGRRMTKAAAQKAAEAAGMIHLDVKRLEAYGLLGKYVKGIGSVNMGRGLLAFAGDSARDMISVCDEIAHSNADPKDRLEAVKTRQELLSQLIRSADSMIRSASVDQEFGNGEAPENAHFLPRRNVVPTSATQVNINLGSAKES